MRAELYETVRNDLGVKIIHREVITAGGSYALRKSGEDYGHNFGDKTGLPGVENSISWNPKY